jgi:hypothetical protein
LTSCCTWPAISLFSRPFGLPFELRLRNLHADHGGEAFAHVVAAEIFLHVFEQARLLAEGVDGAGQRAAEAAQMRAAIHGVDVVGEAEQRFRIAVVVLQRDFHPTVPLGPGFSPSM